jgi:hypothetical protein
MTGFLKPYEMKRILSIPAGLSDGICLPGDGGYLGGIAFDPTKSLFVMELVQ